MLNLKLHVPGIRHISVRMQEAYSFIAKNYCKKITLADIGAVAGLGQSQLISEFKKHFGKSPKKFQLEQRRMSDV